MSEPWDTALTPWGSKDGLGLRFPAQLGKAIQERGYDRATIEITDDGLLLRPYATGRPRVSRKSRPDVVLPEFS